MLSLHFEILNQNQFKLFTKLKFLKEQNFYLAGGTGLALHFGHRTSLDFDFYSRSHFDSLVLSQKIENLFRSKAKITLRQKDTLFCNILGVDLSFFWYKYSLIKKLIETTGPLLASLEDIAAMKLISVYQRPAKRDYIDIFFLLNKFTLEEMFLLVLKKYPNFNIYLSLRALTYFTDLEDEEKRRIEILDKSFSWKKAKETIFKEAQKYQLSMFKK